MSDQRKPRGVARFRERELARITKALRGAGGGKCLPKHCGWNLDREDGKRRVRFRKNGFSVYLTGIPWSPEFLAQYALALQGVQAQAREVGAQRTIVGTLVLSVTGIPRT